MKIILSSRRRHYVARVSIFLITVALIAGMVGCVPAQHNLTVSSTEGGEVTTPGEGTFAYNEGTKVSLMATPASGYQFMDWTGDVDDIADVEDATTAITMNDDYSITAQFAVAQYTFTITSTEGGSVTTPGEGTFSYDKGTVVDLVATPDNGYQFVAWTGSVGSIANVNAASTTITINQYCHITANFVKGIGDWYDLDAIRDNLNGDYLLMNDLDSTTSGYTELASQAANGGKGWEPIGNFSEDPFGVDPVDQFTGSFDGQGYEIREMFIIRLDEAYVGLFSGMGQGGVVKSVGVVNTEVNGNEHVGGLVGGIKGGIVSNSYSTGNVAGHGNVGGLVGGCHSSGTVTNSYSTSSVTSHDAVGGLMGMINGGIVSNSYFAGSVTGNGPIGGLVGDNGRSTVSNSYYNYDEVLINGKNIITVGALFGEDFEQWLANDKFLDVNERLSEESGYYLIDNVNDFKQLLAFGQDGSLKFRLQNDLDLGNEANFYIPHLAGEFDGNGHKIFNLSFNFDSAVQVGLFGHLASGGKVTQVGVENVNITIDIGGGGSLVGWNDGTVNNSYSTGSVNGQGSVGGLVGIIHDGTVSNSYSSSSVTGEWGIGGLVGWHCHGTVSNSYYNYDEVLINGKNIITVGALFGEDFEQWLANDKFLDVNERLSEESGYYLIDNVNDFKQLLAFGQDGSLKFRLQNDLDLGNEANFYIPHLAGEFDGNGHKIFNLSFNFDSAVQVGLFGHLASGGKVTQVGVENVDITGNEGVGGLVGHNFGTVSNCYADGSVTGQWEIGGLVGHSRGIVSNSYSTGSVISGGSVGGLMGSNYGGTVSNSYSTGSVTGGPTIGGLVANNDGAVTHSFWDTETSGQASSDGGTGKTTAEMKSIGTFSGVGWSIMAVGNSGTRNPSYIWNIVDGQTYPFLSWQSVS